MLPSALLDLAINSFVTFFIVIDPIGLIGIFNGLARRLSVTERQRLAFRGAAVGAGVLLLFALGGGRLLSALGISLPAFRAAGGAMLFLIAIRMTFQRDPQRRAETAEDAAGEPPDDAIFPLGIPLIAGPGAITSVLLLMSRYQGQYAEQSVILAMMALVLGLTLAIFLSAAKLGHAIGPTLAEIATRLLGILLAAVAVEYMVVGVRQIWQAG